MAELVALQLISKPDMNANLAEVEQQLQRLKIHTDTLVVLPECVACFGGGDRMLLDLAQPVDGPLVNKLQAMAAKYGVWLVTGTLPLLGTEKGKFTASSLLIDPQGEIAAHYRKIHLFDVQVEDATGQYLESRYTQAGDELVVVDTPFGRLGMAVCYDLRFAGMFQAMGDLDVLVLPSAFTHKTGEAHWEPLLRARAIEKQCYVIAANQGGEHANGRQTYGHSCIISPWGEILAELDYGAGLVQSTQDPALLERIRHAMPVSQHNSFRSHFDQRR